MRMSAIVNVAAVPDVDDDEVVRFWIKLEYRTIGAHALPRLPSTGASEPLHVSLPGLVKAIERCDNAIPNSRR